MFGPMPLLNVTRFNITTFAFTANDEFDEKQPPNYEVTVSFAMQRPDGPDAAANEFRVLLDVRFAPGGEKHANALYDLRIGLIAYFESPVNLGTDRLKIPARVLNNALMITYGIARGIVGQATASHERGQFVLPGMTFDALIAKSGAWFDDQVSPAPEPTSL